MPGPLARATPGPTVNVGSNRPRNRALCCRCGQLRSVAQGYRGRGPDGAGSREVGPWCTWLHCSHCGATTVHALIVDALADQWGRSGCDREQSDRRRDRCRRRIDRRLRALAADGVTIVRAPSSERMHLDEAIIEVIEYADLRGFVIRVCVTTDPSRLLRALDLAEDLLDEPERLGPRADDPGGPWRGLAIVDSTH